MAAAPVIDLTLDDEEKQEAVPLRKRARTVDAAARSPTFPATLRLPPPFYLNELKGGPGVP